MYILHDKILNVFREHCEMQIIEWQGGKHKNLGIYRQISVACDGPL